MKNKKYVWVSLLVLVFSSHLMAESVNNNAILFDAMSPYEDLTEYALEQDKGAIESALHSLNDLFSELQNILPPKRLQLLEDAAHKMTISNKNNDFAQIALVAVDSYKFISEQLDASELEIPKEVVILDYVGFKVHALLKQQNISWDLIAITVKEGVTQWELIKTKVSDKALYDAMNTAIDGLKIASQTQNIPMLKFAAQVDLDLVDLLEGFFEKD